MQVTALQESSSDCQLLLLGDFHKKGPLEIQVRGTVRVTSRNSFFGHNFLLFHLHQSKPKAHHWIVSSRANTRSTQSQKFVKYRGICNKRNTYVNTGDLKILHKKCQNKVDLLWRYLKFLQKIMCFAFNLMHDWRAMNVTVCLAPRHQGHSLSVQWYEFYLYAILIR